MEAIWKKQDHKKKDKNLANRLNRKKIREERLNKYIKTRILH